MLGARLRAAWRRMPLGLKWLIGGGGIFLLLWGIAQIMDAARKEYRWASFEETVSAAESSMRATFPRPMLDSRAARARYADMDAVLLRFETDLAPRELVEKTFGERVERRPWPQTDVVRMFRVPHSILIGWWKPPPLERCAFYGRLQSDLCQMTAAGFVRPEGKLVVYVRLLAPLALRWTEGAPGFAVNFYSGGAAGAAGESGRDR